MERETNRSSVERKLRAHSSTKPSNHNQYFNSPGPTACPASSYATRHSNCRGELPKTHRGESWLGKFWSGRRDLNPRLRPWQGRTLPLSYSRSPNSTLFSPAMRICQPRVCDFLRGLGNSRFNRQARPARHGAGSERASHDVPI